MLRTSTNGTGADPDPTQRFSSTAIPVQGGYGANYYRFETPRIDNLLQVAQPSFKRDVRKAAYLRLQSLMREDLAFLPIWTGNDEAGRGNQLHNPGYNFNDAILPSAASWRAAVAKRALFA